jgi:hypothetical protein
VVQVSVGDHLFFSACYLTQVSISLNPSLDTKGYPLSAKVKVSLECMDASLVTEAGEFHTNSMGNNAKATDLSLKEMSSLSPSS